MAARQAKNEGTLSRLVREAQDLERQRHVADRRLSATLGSPDSRTQADTAQRDIAALETTVPDPVARIVGELHDAQATGLEDIEEI